MKESGSRIPSPGASSLGLMLLLFLLGSGLYWNTLGHGFVFDDPALIQLNPQVAELRWGEMIWSGYRPVRTLTYALNYLLGGDDPFGYHLFNIVLHGLNGVLLFSLLSFWTRSPGVAGLTAVLFLVHPVQTAAVAYISGRKDLLATAFVLGGLLLFTRYRLRGSSPSLVGSYVLFGLAILSKEVALIFPLLLILTDLVLQDSSESRGRSGLLADARRVLARSPRIHAGNGLLAIAGLGYALFLVNADRAEGYWGGSLFTNLGTAFKLFVHYLKLSFWPHPLIADYSGDVFPVSRGLLEPATLASAILLGAFLGLAFFAYRKDRLVAVGLFWFLIALLPVLQFIPFHELAADHLLYLPTGGMALALVGFLAHAVPRRLQTPALVGFALLAFAGAVGTVRRNRDWKDERTLWEATLASAPKSLRANLNLGSLYFFNDFGNRSQRERGFELTMRGWELSPRDPVANNNLGSMLLARARERIEKGELDGAEVLVRQAGQHLDTVLARQPDDGAVLGNVANALRLQGLISEQRGQGERAMQQRLESQRYFEAALKRDVRRYARVNWYNYALLYMDVGKLRLEDKAFYWKALYHEAVKALDRYLALFPGKAEGYFNRGICRRELGNPELARADFRTALHLARDPELFARINRELSRLP